MAALDFPKNPVLNQTYDFPPFQYIWDGVKWKTVGRGADTIADAIAAHKSAVDQHPISGVAGLQAALDDLAEKSGDPVLSAKWVQKRSAMWTGYAAGDGQEVSRALYPDAWAAINAGLVPVCTKAEWIADPAKRGCFHTGDGSTTFGLPDYNGAYPGSYGPVYLGGGTTDGGTILRDRLQNIVGKLNISAAGRFEVGTEGYTGPFAANSTATVLQDATGRTTATQTAGINFDASRVARTGDTTRPITAEGCIAIKLFGAVQNTGSADAAALATAVAALAARVTALEARKSTTLVPATYPSGAPHDTHETVDAALPTNLAINSTYTLTNPFGINVRVDVVVEIWWNNRWADPGWSSSTTGGLGTKATYVQAVGIVVQTGRVMVATNSPDGGGGHGVTSANSAISSAPCRVAIRKWEA